MPFLSGKNVSKAKIYLEQSNKRQLIAFQQTGESGKVSFKYLDPGTYSLIAEFPQQEGKMVRERPRYSVLTKAAFNQKNKTCYYQGMEGYFSIKIKGLRSSEFERFNPMFRERRGEEGDQILFAQFQALKENAQISLVIKALTDAQYKRAVEKAGNDLSLISIPGAR